MSAFFLLFRNRELICEAKKCFLCSNADKITTWSLLMGIVAHFLFSDHLTFSLCVPFNNLHPCLRCWAWPALSLTRSRLTQNSIRNQCCGYSQSCSHILCVGCLCSCAVCPLLLCSSYLLIWDTHDKSFTIVIILWSVCNYSVTSFLFYFVLRELIAPEIRNTWHV